MLVMGSPQFLTQDDFGVGNGISTIKQWQCISPQELPDPDILKLGDLGLNPGLQNIITRLRIIFGQSRMPDLQNTPQILSTTDLHDLTCFVLHRLLLLPSPIETGSQSAIISECIRYATSIYMFIIHGPTYYSHAAMLNSLVIQLEYHVGSLISCIGLQDPLITWLLSVGTVASMGTDNSKFFTDQAITLLTVVDLQCWEHVRVRLESVLWLDSRCGWLFRQAWEELGVAENYESTSCIGV
jgi:hypothetical protein